MSPPHVLPSAIYSQEARQALDHLPTTFRAWITGDCGAKVCILLTKLYLWQPQMSCPYTAADFYMHQTQSVLEVATSIIFCDVLSIGRNTICNPNCKYRDSSTKIWTFSTRNNVTLKYYSPVFSTLLRSLLNFALKRYEPATLPPQPTFQSQKHGY